MYMPDQQAAESMVENRQGKGMQGMRGKGPFTTPNATSSRLQVAQPVAKIIKIFAVRPLVSG